MEKISSEGILFFMLMRKILYLGFVDLSTQPYQEDISNHGSSWLTSETTN